MELLITCDSNSDVKIPEVVYDLRGQTRKHFSPKDYGSGLNGISIVLMCRDSGLNFKQRIRLSKKEKVLYMDIMLNVDELRSVPFQECRRITIPIIESEIINVTSKYKIKDFDSETFFADLKKWFALKLTEKGNPKWE